MSEPAGDRGRVGRPRNEALTERILHAAREELAAAGITAFSIRQVAKRAAVSRKTVSARWPDADTLLHDALGAIDEIHFEPTGDLRADLTTAGMQFIKGLRSDALDLQLRVTAEAKNNPEAYAMMQRRVLEPMSRAVVAAFQTGQRTGSVRGGDVSWLVRGFVGALMARTFERPDRGAPTAGDLADLIDEIARWAAPAEIRTGSQPESSRNCQP